MTVKRCPLALMICVALLSLSTPAAAVNSYEGDGLYESPTRWQPTYLATQISNGQPWGDVAYFFNWWNTPVGMQGLTDTGDRTFELGYKATQATSSCVLEQFGQTGIPSEVEVKWDYSEDAYDAVVWFADLGPLEADQQQNPTRTYSAFGKCLANDDAYWKDDPGAYLQIQRGHWDAVQDPIGTVSDTSINVAPGETSWRGFPDQSQFDNEDISYSYFYAAWNRDHNFEEGDPAWSTDGTATLERKCGRGNAFEGDCFMQVTPATSSGPSYLHQTFTILDLYRTIPNLDAYRYGSGEGNATQLEVALRCRAPTTCHPDVYLITGGVQKVLQIDVPADLDWHWVTVDESEMWPSLPDTDQYSLWVDVRRKKMDIDALWVASDLVTG